MSPICKKANQDGTYTVYRGDDAIAWGLTRAAADMLIDRLCGGASSGR